MEVKVIIKIVLGFSTLVYLYFLVSSYLFYSKPPMSKILGIFESYLNQLISLDVRTAEMLKFDPFVELISEARPVVDEVASLRAQTEIYENMERIPGGPRQFMSTALTALDRITLEVFIFQNRYRQIVAKMNRNITVLVSTEVAGLQDGFLAAILKYDDTLQSYKIYFGHDENEPVQPNVQIPIPRILRWLNELKKKFIQFEEFFPGLDTFDVMSGKIQGVFTTMEQVEVAKAITDISATHGETTFSEILPLWYKKMAEIKIRVDQIYEHQDMSKHRYEDLMMGVDLDISSTKDRVRNLAKPNTKKVEL